MAGNFCQPANQQQQQQPATSISQCRRPPLHACHPLLLRYRDTYCHTILSPPPPSIHCYINRRQGRSFSHFFHRVASYYHYFIDIGALPRSTTYIARHLSNLLAQNNNIMLAADKLQLQSTLRQQATALKEKEFNLHHGNLMTVGTQAAVLAGLDVTMFIEFQPPPNEEWVSVAMSNDASRVEESCCILCCISFCLY